MKTETTQKYRIIGFTDSRIECDCCGKTDLKGTYVMSDEFDNELYFGVVCGSKASGLTIVEIKNEVSKIKKRTKLVDQLNEMISNSNNQHSQNQIIKFINKKGLDLITFLEKHGEIIEDYISWKVYQYGSNCFNVDSGNVYCNGKVIYQK